MRRIAALACLVLALSAPGTAFARAYGDTESGRSFDIARDLVPLETILRQIERRYPGHQLNVNGPSSGVYRIKWLTDEGAVLYILADAETGAILSVDGG